MIFNSKATKANKGNDHSFTQDNRFIPSDFTTTENPEEGRECLFETVVVSSPVLASSRLALESDKRLLNRGDVDQLNSLLSTLYIGDVPSKKIGNVKEESKEDPCSSPSSSLRESAQGLFDTTVVDVKSLTIFKVRRSARLAIRVGSGK